jgi:hypothetical protein
VRRDKTRGAKNPQGILREDCTERPRAAFRPTSRRGSRRGRASAAPRDRGHRVDGEVAPPEVRLDRRAFDLREVDLPLSRHAENPRRGRGELDRPAEARALHRPRDPPGIGGHGGVDFEHLAPELEVARGASYDPDFLSETKAIRASATSSGRRERAAAPRAAPSDEP